MIAERRLAAVLLFHAGLILCWSVGSTAQVSTHLAAVMPPCSCLNGFSVLYYILSHRDQLAQAILRDVAELG